MSFNDTLSDVDDDSEDVRWISENLSNAFSPIDKPNKSKLLNDYYSKDLFLFNILF